MKTLIVLAAISCCQAAIILTPKNPDDVGAAVTFNNQDVKLSEVTISLVYEYFIHQVHLFRRESWRRLLATKLALLA
ncbi:hypothetical protein CEXT_785391 [Caerostris extrusa]|uniref:Uncharacterized protein n=1 Tax=Caerostris extrusa TaxID=172846 RepID=A0AAV4NW80_CAEEX|nr:hypothetical protein CEXT_785391 [Caerostris extrusa]